VGEEARNLQDIDRAVAHDLIGQRRVAANEVADIG
jgi:hypothetical protein